MAPRNSRCSPRPTRRNSGAPRAASSTRSPPAAATSYHGGAYGYLRPGGWSATERFAPGQNLLGDRNQMGADFGGPVRHDQLFFFANFERLTDHFDGLNRITTPTLADASGNSIARIELYRHRGAMRGGHQIHPGANERAGALLAELDQRPGTNRLPPQRGQLVQHRLQRHESKLPGSGAAPIGSARWRLAGLAEFHRRHALRPHGLDLRAHRQLVQRNAPGNVRRSLVVSRFDRGTRHRQRGDHSRRRHRGQSLSELLAPRREAISAG